MVIHTTDADCAGHLDSDEQCTVCGVSHTATCAECNGRGFHDVDCPEQYDFGTVEYAAAKVQWDAMLADAQDVMDEQNRNYERDCI